MNPPPTDLPELRRARALWVKQQIPQALWLFERTARQYPRHVLALVDASRAMGAVYQYRRAEQYLARLESLGSKSPRVLQLVAQTYRLIRRPHQAIKCFETCAALGNVEPDVLLELAILCERTGQLEHADGYVSRWLRLGLPADEGLVVKAQVLRRQGRLDQAADRLRRVTRNTHAHWLTRTRAAAELASVYDAQGAYPDAWQAVTVARELVKPHAAAARQHRDRVVPPLQRLAAEFSRKQLERWRSELAAEESSRQAVTLLTGLPRSGTTLLAQILAADPSVVCGDEWDAFPRWIFPMMLGRVAVEQLDAGVLDRLPAKHLARKRSMYLRFLAAALEQPLHGRVLIDKNPSLLPLVPAYLRLLPHAKLVVVQRDPRDVLVSCWLTYFPLNDFSVDLLTLEQAVARIEAELRLSEWIQAQLDDAHVLCRYEDLVRRPSETIAPLMTALGLDTRRALVDRRHESGMSFVQSPSYAQVQQPIHDHAVGRWRNYQQHLDPVATQLDELAQRLGYA